METIDILKIDEIDEDSIVILWKKDTETIKVINNRTSSVENLLDLQITNSDQKLLNSNNKKIENNQSNIVENSESDSFDNKIYLLHSENSIDKSELLHTEEILNQSEIVKKYSVPKMDNNTICHSAQSMDDNAICQQDNNKRTIKIVKSKSSSDCKTILRNNNEKIDLQHEPTENSNSKSSELSLGNDINTASVSAGTTAPLLKRESFIRRSFTTIFKRGVNRNSVTKNFSSTSCSSSSSSSSSEKSNSKEKLIPYDDNESLDNDTNNNNEKKINGKEKMINDKLKLVKYDDLINDNSEMIDSNSIPDSIIRIKHGDRRNSCSSSTCSERSTNCVNFGIRSAPGSPMAPLQGQTDAHGQSVINLNTITKSPSHLNSNNSNNNINNNNNNNNSANNTTKLDSKSQKQLTPSPVASTTSTATIAYQSQQSQEKLEKHRSISPHPIKSHSTSSVVSVSSTSGTATGKNDIPEKEKKRKELSSSRQKKFHRHFQQVAKDEKVLNYFSCALVSDILLQGHLYITENYFAFYSNVFGFVTKLLIPTSSVIKISKEKTAKIIPNAVGVATIDERHVFGSFMSREAAFRLMCSVCPPLEIIEIPKIPDVEICEESIEDDSSCSISGNESPPQLLDSTGASTNGTCGGTTGSSDASQTVRHRPLPTVAVVGVNSKTDEIDGPVKLIIANCTTSTPVKILKQLPISSRITSTGVSTTIPATTTSTSAISRIKSLITFKFPTNLHIVYLGILLSIILTLFSAFLMYRILEIEAKASYRTLDINKWELNNDGSGGDEIYAEALKWQKELQTKNTEEAQLLLNTNLEQIARVRKSLETLSMLIHDTNAQFDSGGSDGGAVENYERT